ncbi:MAG TPA: recombination protein RecR [Deltaproteobacteria bacterium]|nr:MAG: recombination protein RecR [Deltaproteobacteria bacterium GWA2_55_82]OGQ64997.1 MAG: recombination protein RecR [Deltaproteobacteria bacterium RIFCSPLOWO2_02_FULL_55_12]OIJ73819.1 MAG: recombination protein RecR [Deltaproteobacteria bacterium GWC2_55_46]HBG45775.1 recombination protein RecR [Deltaproteobacteria bacterium]HCY09806.1 recombination protein RecR [Deltaproteobacteria bacterium]
MQYAEPINNLIRAISRLPGIGEKTATRLALFILNADKEYAAGLADAIASVKEKVSLCPVCMTFSDAATCRICADEQRDPSTVCVVSDYKDMTALESMGAYRGRYHILHGNLAPLKGVGPDEIRIRELVARVEAGGVNEVILATGFDSEGEATSAYLARLLKPYGVMVTRLASGIPVGSYVEFMDGATLGRALDGRREV